MTPEEFKEEMQRLYDHYHEHVGDPEIFHALADDLVIKALREAGYEEGIGIFEKATRWCG